ncbi:hypothetical protein PC128_g14787 [Phytophthora cactorum]|nr:hypothetical protein PC128_g14787 [Phytophthora cactorum]
MAEAPPDQKRKLDEPPGARKRRRVRSSVEGASAETARSLGGVAAVKDVSGNVSGAVDQAADVEPNEKGDRDEEAARASGAAGIVGHGGEAGDDVGAGYDDAAGHIAVAGRGAQGGSGGRTTRRVASTASAEGDEVDSSEVGFDMDVGMDVDGAAGQAVGSSRGVRGLVAAAPDSPRPGSATATGKQELLRRHHIHRLSCFRTST